MAENQRKQHLLEARIGALQVTSEVSSSSGMGKEATSLSSIGPFSIVQDTSGIITIGGLDLDDCRSFLCDYLDQGEKYGNRRGLVEELTKMVVSHKNKVILNTFRP